MFATRERRRGVAGLVDVAFTDRHGGISKPPFDSLDLGREDRDRRDEFEANAQIVADAFDVPTLVTMRQVHGNDVAIVGATSQSGSEVDAMVSISPDVALCVRVADCVPVLLADADRGVIGVAHAGRQGIVLGVVARAIDAMRDQGAESIDAWVGPHACGGCYEVPAQLRAEVADVVPEAYANTTWETPSLDLGAAVHAQLRQQDCAITMTSTCTRESADLFSYRRDGELAGRFGGLVVLREIERE